MIIFDDVSMTIPLERRKAFALSPRREILSSVNLQIPCDRRIALFANSGHDISLLMNLMSGLIVPTSGTVSRRAKVSFPSGHFGSFSELLSVRNNVAHIAGIYGVDGQSLVEFIQNVVHLGPAFDGPWSRVPRDRQHLISQIILFSIPFDMYLLAGAVPQPAKSGPARNLYNMFLERTKSAGFVMVARNPELARRHCDMALVLHQRQLHLFDDLDRAAMLTHKARRRSGLASAQTR
jgi:capsular polysaccharide transport system ATP-binding protein